MKFLLRLQKWIQFALVSDGSNRAVARMDAGLIRQDHQFGAQRVHDLFQRAAPQVSTPDAPCKERVPGKQLRPGKHNLLWLLWYVQFFFLSGRRELSLSGRGILFTFTQIQSRRQPSGVIWEKKRHASRGVSRRVKNDRLKRTPAQNV